MALSFAIPSGSDFNPNGIAWQDNEFAAYPDKVWAFDDSEFFGSFFLDKIHDSYKMQFGNDATARAAAEAALDKIEVDLQSEGSALRYPKAVYMAFRDNLLSRTFASEDIYNAVLGKNAVAKN